MSRDLEINWNFIKIKEKLSIGQNPWLNESEFDFLEKPIEGGL